MKRSKLRKLFGVASLLALFGVGALLFTNGVEAKDEDSGRIVVDSPASVKINKVMDNTAGYKPAGDGDKFKFAVTRLSDEEAEKFFPGSKLTPMGGSELGTTSGDTEKLEVELDGSKATEAVTDAQKTVSKTINLANLTDSGYYVYKIAEEKPTDLDSSVWNYSDEKYILIVRVTEEDEEAYDDDDDNTHIKQVANLYKIDTSDGGEKLGDTKLKQADFTNTLKTQTKKVKISKYVVGDDADLASLVDNKYTIHVKVTKPDGTNSAETFDVKISTSPQETTKTGNYSVEGFDIELEDGQNATMDLPLGTKLEVYEKAPGKRFEVKIDPNSDTEAEEGASGYEVMNSDDQNSSVVTDIVTSEANDLNSIFVTNKIKSLVNTGVKLVTSPFVVLLAVVVVAFGGYVVVKRRLNVK